MTQMIPFAESPRRKQSGSWSMHNRSVESASCQPPAGGAPQSIEARFRALVQEHRKPLFRFVLRNVGSPADAEDIAQQAFVEAYRALPGFRGESELSTWLYGIAMNLVRNYLNRAPHRVRKFESDDVLAGLESGTDGPETLIHRFELMTRLYAAVGTLSEDLKQTFLLVAIEGRSYQEASEILSVPIGTIRSRLFRAREALKAGLPGLHDALRA